MGGLGAPPALRAPPSSASPLPLHCLLPGRGARSGPAAQCLRRSSSRDGGRGRPTTPRVPPQALPRPARPGPATFGFTGRLLRGPGTSAAPWVTLVRPSPRTSARDAREQLSRADADGKHAKPRLLPGARPGTYAGRRRAARGDPLRDGTKCKPYFETKERIIIFFKYGLLTLFFFLFAKSTSM